MNEKTSLKDLGALVTAGKLKLGRIGSGEPLIRERTTHDICKLAYAALPSSFDDATEGAQAIQTAIRVVLSDAVLDAYELGKRHGAAEERMRIGVEKFVDGKRAELLLPSAVAAIMAQTGLTELTLNLPNVATVFKRHAINYTLSDDNQHVVYKLTPVDDGGAQ